MQKSDLQTVSLLHNSVNKLHDYKILNSAIPIYTGALPKNAACFLYFYGTRHERLYKKCHRLRIKKPELGAGFNMLKWDPKDLNFGPLDYEFPINDFLSLTILQFLQTFFSC